jgi:transcriptional regulator with XRE-family HTH domain
MDEMLKHMGQVIRDGRKSRGMTQQDLADLTGHGLRHIQRIELGEVNPSFEVLYTLIHRLGISAEPLFYPEIAEDEKEVKNLMAKLSACAVGERQIILQTMDYLAAQFLSQHQTQQARKEEEKDLAGAGI